MAEALNILDAREATRIEKLRSFAILDTPQEQEFDTIVLIAQRLLGMPIALVSLVDEHRQWFKAKCGLAVSETGRDVSFCEHALEEDDIMIVEDARLDPRFADNPFVVGEANVRFYAGVPLRPAAPGFADDLPAVGTLCVIDVKPRTLSDDDKRLLRELAGLVSTLIRARSTAAIATRMAQDDREHAELLERQQVQLRQAERMAGIGSWRLDLPDQTIHWSDQVYAIHGLPAGQMPGMEKAMSFYPPDRRPEIIELVQRGVAHAEPFDFESDFLTADGRIRRVRSMGEPHFVDGRAVALIGLFQDITERHTREQSLRLSADTDMLTGLPNRACFEKELADTAAKAQAAGEPACLLILDLDGFKGVNDTFGHGAGDDVLRVMADRLRRLAYRDFAARLGGDEFVMLVTRPRDCARIEDVIANVLRTLRYSVERDGQCRTVSATVGASLLDATIGEPGEWMRRADLALYEAKRARRGSARVYGTDIALDPPGTVNRAA